MAQGDPPAKQWADSNGNVVAEIRYDVANDDLIIDTIGGTDIDFQQSDLSNINSVDAEQVNDTVVASAGDDIQTLLNSVEGSSITRGGTVKLKAGQEYTLSQTTFPIRIPGGVTLDISGSFISPDSDANRLFEFETNSTIIGHGAEIFENAFTGDIFVFDDDIASFGNRDNTGIFGFPRVASTDAAVINLEQTAANAITGLYLEVALDNCYRVVSCGVGDVNGFINNNTFVFKGSVGGSGSTSSFTFFGDDGDIRGNQFLFPNLQVKNGVSQLFDINSDGMQQNYFAGNIADPQNASVLVKWGSGIGTFNTIALDPGYYQAGYSVNRQDGGQRGNIIKPLNYPALNPIDLSTWSPPDNTVWVDDGTNTTSGNAELAIRAGGSWFTMGGDTI